MQVSCIILIDIVVHFDYHYSISISSYIFSSYKITGIFYRRFSPVFNGSNRLSFSFSGR